MNSNRDNWPKLEMVLKSSEPAIEPTMQENIASAIKLIFSTNWALNTNPPAIRYRDTYFRRPTNGEWVAMWVLPSASFAVDMGTNKITRQIGIVLFQIFTKKDSGLPRAMEICDMISDIFDNQMFDLNSDKSITTTINKEVLTVVTGNGDSVVPISILFRPFGQIPVGERKDCFQLNASVPFVADYEYDNPF